MEPSWDLGIKFSKSSCIVKMVELLLSPKLTLHLVFEWRHTGFHDPNLQPSTILLCHRWRLCSSRVLANVPGCNATNINPHYILVFHPQLARSSITHGISNYPSDLRNIVFTILNACIQTSCRNRFNMSYCKSIRATTERCKVSKDTTQNIVNRYGASVSVRETNVSDN